MPGGRPGKPNTRDARATGDQVCPPPPPAAASGAPETVVPDEEEGPVLGGELSCFSPFFFFVFFMAVCSQGLGKVVAQCPAKDEMWHIWHTHVLGITFPGCTISR